MKKITLIILLLTTAVGFSQAPSGAAPTPPARDAADVISLFSQTTDGSTTVYSDISVADFNPNWGSTSGNVTIDAQGGDLALTYPAFHYQGIVIGSNVNLSGMTTMHVNIWTNSISPNVFLISATTGEKSVNVASTPGAWTSVEIPLTDFTSQGLSIADIKELKFDGGDSSTPIYIDNIYFSKPPADPATDATLSDLQVDGVTIDGFSAGTTAYTYELVVGTTTAPSITSATTTNAGASRVITQASTIPGDATIVVTASNGTDMETYTVSFTATLPNTPPEPSTPAGEALGLLSDITDTGSITNFWNPSYYFGSNVGTPDLDPSGNVSKAVKMDFSVAGWGGGINNGSDVYTDVTAYGYLNFSYFAVDEPAGVNGHEVKFILIGGGAGPSGGAGEFDYVLKEPGNGGDGDLIFGSWQNVSVPLSFFVGKGWKTDNFFQFKLGTTSDLNTKVVYFDNMFFSVNQGTLSTKNYNFANISLYPNPAKNSLNIKSLETIKRVSIYNILGKEIRNITTNSNQPTIDVEDLAPGIYIIKYQINSTVGSIKFVKE